MTKVQNGKKVIHTDLVQQVFPDAAKIDHHWEEIV